MRRGGSNWGSSLSLPTRTESKGSERTQSLSLSLSQLVKNKSNHIRSMKVSRWNKRVKTVFQGKGTMVNREGYFVKLLTDAIGIFKQWER